MSGWDVRVRKTLQAASTTAIPLRAREAWADLQAAIAAQRTPTPCVASSDWTAGDRAAQARAAEGCLACPVFVSCLTYCRLGDEPAGVWGGMTPTERAADRRHRHALEQSGQPGWTPPKKEK